VLTRPRGDPSLAFRVPLSSPLTRFLTRRSAPGKCFDYRLGNRSALDWVVNQYQVTEHKRSGIKSDPNRKDDREYIVRLVGQVIRVSLETVRIVENLSVEYC
jgi:predicted helicase